MCVEKRKCEQVQNGIFLSYHRMSSSVVVWLVQCSKQCFHYICVIVANGPLECRAQLSTLVVQLQVQAWVHQQGLHNRRMTQITCPAERRVVVLQRNKRVFNLKDISNLHAKVLTKLSRLTLISARARKIFTFSVSPQSTAARNCA